MKNACYTRWKKKFIWEEVKEMIKLRNSLAAKSNERN